MFPHPVIFKQISSLKPILSQRNSNNWLNIGRWSIANMLHKYHTIIGSRYEADITIANGKPIIVQ